MPNWRLVIWQARDLRGTGGPGGRRRPRDRRCARLRAGANSFAEFPPEGCGRAVAAHNRASGPIGSGAPGSCAAAACDSPLQPRAPSGSRSRGIRSCRGIRGDPRRMASRYSVARFTRSERYRKVEEPVRRCVLLRPCSGDTARSFGPRSVQFQTTKSSRRGSMSRTANSKPPVTRHRCS